MNPGRKKSDASERNFFQLCFPCFGRPVIDCDEIMLKSFGREFTEYEYVIENLAIRRAPKVLLDSCQHYQPPPKMKSRYGQTKSPPTRDFGGNASREKGPEVTVGPVIRANDSAEENVRQQQSQVVSQSKNVSAPFAPNQALAGLSPSYMAATPKRMNHLPRSPCRFTEGEDIKIKLQHEDVMRKSLVPPNNALYRVDVPKKMQVSADVHKDDEITEHYSNKAKGIPTEIQATINALKVARPTTFSSLPRKNHRNLLRSVSDTSCDKETFCNFLGLENFKEETSEETRSSHLNYRFMENKRKPFSQFRKRATSAKRLGIVC